MRLETLINESNKRLFHKMGNQAHCLHSILPPLPCSARLQTRPKGQPYELPRYKYDLSCKSFVLRCLYNFVWFYVFWLPIWFYLCCSHTFDMCSIKEIYIRKSYECIVSLCTNRSIFIAHAKCLLLAFIVIEQWSTFPDNRCIWNPYFSIL